MADSQIEVASASVGVAKKSAWSKQLFLLCVAFVCVRLPLLLCMPMSEAPDEFTHHWVIRFMREHGRLPDAREVAAGGAAAVYGSLPQMGYLPHAALAWFSPPSQILYERFGSLLGGLILLYSAYKLAPLLFAKNKLLRLALPVVLIVHPQLAFVQAYANSDATAMALSGLVLLLTVRSIAGGVRVGRSALIGLLLGWLLLSKYAGIAVAAGVGFGLIGACLVNETSLATALSSALACLSTGLLACTWWFWRNTAQFGGDTFGMQTMYRSWAIAYHKELHYYLPIGSIVTSLRWWRMMFFSFWGLFGYMHRYLFRPVYLGYLGYSIAAAVGWLMLLAKRRSVVRTDTATVPLWRNADIAVWGCLIVIVACNLAAMLWASTGNLGGPQGRYLFVSELPVVALLLAGMHACAGKYGDKVVISFLIFNALVCAGAWIMLLSAFATR